MWARRLTLIAAALVLPKFALVDDTSASAFVLVAKRDISGKTGWPLTSVEVRSGGGISRVDGDGITLAEAQLSEADRTKLEALVSSLPMTPPECGPPMGSDMPETEFAIEYSARTLTFRIPKNCVLSGDFEKLETLLDLAERTYLPSE